MTTTKNILVAPLNWGLGHATRCIPIIDKLREFGFNPILASDGDAIKLLKKEFPSLTTIELPSYQIKYAKNARFFKWKMAWSIPRMLKAIQNEKKITQKIIEQYQIDGIISDNRFGVVNKRIPCVFITHQLNVLSGSTTFLTSALHRNWIKNFQECWVPDFQDLPHLSGKLGHLKKTKLNIKYLGTLSRFEKKEIEEMYDLAVVLSGPEPQRTIFEKMIATQIHLFEGKVIFIKGKIEDEEKSESLGNTTFYNFMKTKDLEQALNQSKKVLSRSGYTTIMDLVKLQKKAFFVPTPGQTEQEYLAKHLQKQKIAPYASQDNFRIELLNEINLYKGFEDASLEPNWEYLFGIFRKNR